MWCVYAIGAWLVLMVLLSIMEHRRMRRIAASRPGENFDTFCAACAHEEFPPDVLLAVFTLFQTWGNSPASAFPVRPDDNIREIYRMEGDDLEYEILELIAECGRVLPPEHQLQLLPPVKTVRDAVRLVSACPKAPKA